MPAPKPIRINSARHAYAATNKKKEEVSIAKVLVILAVLGGIAFAGWHFREKLLSFLPAGAGKSAAPAAEIAETEGPEAEETASARNLDAVPDDWVSVAPDFPAWEADAAVAGETAESASVSAPAAATAAERAERELMPAYNEASKAFNAALEGYNAVRKDLTLADTRKKAEALAEKAVEGYRPLAGRMKTVPVDKNLADAESLLKELRALQRYMEMNAGFAAPGSARTGRPHAAPARNVPTRAPVATRTAAPTASAAATKTATATRSADQTMVRAPNLD